MARSYNNNNNNNNNNGRQERLISAQVHVRRTDTSILIRPHFLSNCCLPSLANNYIPCTATTTRDNHVDC
jgi:hypothetical protein